MRLVELKQTFISLEEAIRNIQLNKEDRYEWFAVKNKKKALLEVGGNNKNNILELKAYIPKIENKTYISHPNGFVQSEYSVTSKGYLAYPTFYVDLPPDWNIEKMITFLNTTDFRTYLPKLTSYQRIKEWEMVHELQSL